MPLKRYRLRLSGSTSAQASGKIYASPRFSGDVPVLAERINVRRTAQSRVVRLEPGRYRFEFDSSGSGSFVLEWLNEETAAVETTSASYSAPGLAQVFELRVEEHA